jgi:prevent-host-death family protein
MSVSIRELKAHMSRYLAEARAGQTVEITSHRKVIARLSGVPEGAESGLPRLLAAHAAQWGGGKPVGADIHLSAGGRLVSELVLEGRG